MDMDVYFKEGLKWQQKCHCFQSFPGSCPVISLFSGIPAILAKKWSQESNKVLAGEADINKAGLYDFDLPSKFYKSSRRKQNNEINAGKWAKNNFVIQKLFSWLSLSSVRLFTQIKLCKAKAYSTLRVHYIDQDSTQYKREQYKLSNLKHNTLKFEFD